MRASRVGSAEVLPPDNFYAVVQALSKSYFDIAERHNLPFYLGALLYGMGYHAEVGRHLEQSVAQYVPEPKALYILALCHHALGRLGSTLECLEQALAADPACQPAKALRIELEAMVRRRGAGGGENSRGGERRTPPREPLRPR